LAQHLEPGVSSKNNEDAFSGLFIVEHANIELAEHPWYKDIIYYLQFQKCPNNIKNHQRRRIRLEASKYIILGISLFSRTTDGLLLRCVDDTTSQKTLKKINGSIDLYIHIGGHFTAKSTSFKILKLVFTGL
jgi:hypothetical protein